MGLLSRLLGREPDAQARGENVARTLEALAQLDPIWSTEDRERAVHGAATHRVAAAADRGPRAPAPPAPARVPADRGPRLRRLRRGRPARTACSSCRSSRRSSTTSPARRWPVTPGRRCAAASTGPSTGTDRRGARAAAGGCRETPAWGTIMRASGPAASFLLVRVRCRRLTVRPAPSQSRHRPLEDGVRDVWVTRRLGRRTGRKHSTHGLALAVGEPALVLAVVAPERQADARTRTRTPSLRGAFLSRDQFICRSFRSVGCP